MPRLSQAPIVTTTVSTKVQLTPALRQKILAKLTEEQRMTEEIELLKMRCEEMKAAVEDIFAEAGELDALMAGCEVAGWKVKLVSDAEQSTLDKGALMKATGITAEDIAAATTKSPKKAYMNITAPAEVKAAAKAAKEAALAAAKKKR